MADDMLPDVEQVKFDAEPVKVAVGSLGLPAVVPRKVAVGHGLMYEEL